MSEIKETAYSKTLPQPSELTKPFWDYCRKHELHMQFCKGCSEWIWYPKAWCPTCGKRDKIEWKKLSGKGMVYSFTIIRQVIDNSPAFQNELPFTVGLIELEEGPRLYSKVTGFQPDEMKIGDKVQIYYDDVTSEISLPKFKKVSRG